jgi:hypothetical protein
MRRSYAIAFLLLLAAPAAAQQQQQPPPDPQALFRQTLLDDAKTSAEVKEMLRSGRGFVEPAPLFADVTGDGKSDALVRVMTGGAAGAVAVFALSTDGTTSSNLRPVFRTDGLYRATVKVNAAHNLVIRVPLYSPGDPLCCPSRARDRTYAWSAKDKRLHRVSSVEFTLAK